MTAIVCGSRHYADAARVRLILDAAMERLGLDTIIEGAATGADTLAKEWGLGRVNVIEVRPDDDWPSAGPRRNALMLRILMGAEGAKAVIAFPGGDGTENMVRQATAAGVRVIRA